MSRRHLWNRHLPYAVEQGLIPIADGISASSLSLGTISPMVSLVDSLNLKTRIDLEQRIWLAQTLYELLCSPIAANLSDMYANAIVKLIKNEELMPTGSLVLDWRPLSKILIPVLQPRKRDRAPPGQIKYLKSITVLASKARRFFGPNATQEILQEVLPKLQANDSTSWLTNFSFLLIFIPIHSIPTSLVHGKSFYWIPSLFQLWSLVTNISCDVILMELFASMSEIHLGVELWSRDQLDTIFCVGVKNIGLPVGQSNALEKMPSSLDVSSKSRGSSMDSQMKTQIQLFASFIAYSIYSDDVDGAPKNVVLDHLETMMTSLEGYFHPSNVGGWTAPLAKFLQSLSSSFLKRIHQEEALDSKVAPEARLSPATRKRFVACLKNAVFISIFGKDQGAVMASQTALASLAWIDPDTIVPFFLRIAYPALETLTETHRTLSCIRSLAWLSGPLLRRSVFPSGGHHLANILQLTLPGLDINDMRKTGMTLIFIACTIMQVPLFDATQYMSDDLSEDDAACCLATGDFESWIVAYLDRIFALFENLPQSFGTEGDGSSVESTVLNYIRVSCSLVFQQLSPALESTVLSKLVSFAKSTIVPSATKVFAQICGSICPGDPKKRLNAFFTLCESKIMEELESGAANEKTGGALTANPNPHGFALMSDATLHWFQAILYSVVEQSGDELIPYKSRLEALLKVCLQKCNSRVGYKWAAKLLQHSVSSLISIYPKDHRSHNKDIWESEEMLKRGYLYWSPELALQDLVIDWHVASPIEIATACDLIRPLLDTVVGQIKNIVNELTQLASPASEKGRSHDICKALVILRSIIYAVTGLLKPEPSSSHSDETEDLTLFAFKYDKKPIETGFPLADPTHPDYVYWKSRKEEIGTLLCDLVDALERHRPDDVVSFNMAIKAISVYLNTLGMGYPQYDALYMSFRFTRASMRLYDHQKLLFPRYVLVQRAHVLHLSRIKAAISQQPLTPLVKRLAGLLFNLSLSKYTLVRKSSQGKLSLTLKSFGLLRYELYPKLISALQEPGVGDESSERTKGVLYLLRSRQFMTLAQTYWKFANMFTGALIRAQNGKPTVLELVRKAFMDFSTGYFQIMHTSVPSSKAIELALPFSNAANVERLKDIEARRIIVSKESHARILQDMLMLAQSPTIHWRFASMAISLLEMFLETGDAIPPNIISFALSLLVNDHPSIRRLSMTLCLQILINLKKRAIEAGTIKSSTIKRFIEGTHPDVDKALNLQDPEGVGWLGRPQTVKVYAHRKHVKPSSPAFTDPTCPDAFKIFEDTFKSTQFWDSFTKFTSQETSATVEFFQMGTAWFCQRLFEYFEAPLMPFVQGCVENLVLQAGDKSKQRAASEIVGGILRGSKNWGFQDLETLDTWIVELYDRAFLNASIESLVFWIQSLQHAMAKRDPKRYSLIIERIVRMPLDPDGSSFITETKKINMIRTLFVTFTWRISDLAPSVLVKQCTMVASPYYDIRQAVGGLLSEITKGTFSARIKDITAWMTNVEREWLEKGIGAGLLSSHETREPNLYLLFQQLQGWHSLPWDRKSQTSSTYSRASETLLAWFGSALMSYRVVGTFPYLTDILTELFRMAEYPSNELQIQATNILLIYAQLPHHSSVLPTAVRLLISFLGTVGEEEDTLVTWHRKSRVLPVLQVLFFRHLHLMDDDLASEVVQAVTGLLFDSQIEVRQIASDTLSGFVQCSKPGLLEMLKSRCISDLKRYPAKKRISGSSTSASPTNNGNNDMVIKRHGAILGLCALVSAFPYSVPLWMPGVLITLSECVSDLSPINTSVKKVFAEFKRTHRDTWEEDRLSFTEDQLYLLTDILISPGYYA